MNPQESIKDKYKKKLYWTILLKRLKILQSVCLVSTGMLSLIENQSAKSSSTDRNNSSKTCKSNGMFLEFDTSTGSIEKPISKRLLTYIASYFGKPLCLAIYLLIHVDFNSTESVER